MNFTGGISSMSIINGVTYINGQRVDTPSRGIISGNSMSQACANLIITGNVGQRAKISSTSSNITVNGNIEQGAKVKTVNGTINANVVRSNAEVRATNGAINVDEIHSNAEVRTTNGAINANVVHSNAEVRTTNGAINANVVHSNAEVRTTNGNVRINDDRRSRRGSSRSHDRYNPFDPNFGANLNTYTNLRGMFKKVCQTEK
ncbi:MAG: hypothetical protein sGL2_11110 [Candidatus Mesenet longicola]|nr:MAG: hypothetical protein sGL2_11110 [Candidatus Mesenet longicola]